MFNVIQFVVREKSGCLIPLNNVNDRIKAMLGISMTSVERLKREIREQEREILETENERIAIQKKRDQEKQDKENSAFRATLRLRHPRTRSSSISTAPYTTTRIFVPVAKPSNKSGHVGPSPIVLTDDQKENIRYHVHLMLAERVYPTTYKILTRILYDDPDFPIGSVPVLWRWMKKLGFSYKKTAKVIVPLDSLFYMAARARYFAKINELRNNGTLIFWHDETWCNQNEEKTFIWTDKDTGSGRLRQNSGKRLAISALMGQSGFHASSIDIFECNEDHNMNSTHFLTWIDRTASLLRKELSKICFLLFPPLSLILEKDAKIVLVIDNATWHNRLTQDTAPPKRSWRKEAIIQWLNRHNIVVPVKAVKAELLEIAFNNLPEKKYEIDEAAKKYNVGILR
ncbi:unnamed protein product [Rotaria sp. Silwood2]|nr:unnamed protein product [Rotaria sp. Silwood2]CAF4348704.1 unnamed protein product [Rotaria sp. Silwood2]CAF4392954.1 unnamed protein product [Rotaria sp. Silwood2]